LSVKIVIMLLLSSYRVRVGFEMYLTQLDSGSFVVHVDTGQLAGSVGVTLETDSFTTASTMFPKDDTAQLWVNAADGIIPPGWESETFANWDIEGGVLTLIVGVLEDVNVSNTIVLLQLLLVFLLVHFDNWSLSQLFHFKVVGELGVSAWLLNLGLGRRAGG